MKWTDSQCEKLQTLQNEHKLLAPQSSASSQKTSHEGQVQKPPGNSYIFPGRLKFPNTTLPTNLQLSKLTKTTPEMDQPRFKLWKHTLGGNLYPTVTQSDLQNAAKNAKSQSKCIFYVLVVNVEPSAHTLFIKR